MIYEWVQKLLGRSDIYIGGRLYMRRFRLIRTRWFGVRIHQIVRSDADRELHDHPFDFTSLILRGGYFEHLPNGVMRWYGAGGINRKKAEDLHRLELLPARTAKIVENVIRFGGERATWTLVFTGPIRRSWGFQTSEGWVHWREFTESREGIGSLAGPWATESSI